MYIHLGHEHVYIYTHSGVCCNVYKHTNLKNKPEQAVGGSRKGHRYSTGKGTQWPFPEHAYQQI